MNITKQGNRYVVNRHGTYLSLDLSEVKELKRLMEGVIEDSRPEPFRTIVGCIKGFFLMGRNR